MKNKVAHILIVACLVAMVLPVSAQESSLPENEYVDAERDRYERERIINSPGEGSDFRYYPRTSPSTTPTNPVVSRDSAEVKPATPPPVVSSQKTKAAPQTKSVPPVKPQEKVPTKPEDDSILSYNFLYYIIQKYKLQDIVD